MDFILRREGDTFVILDDTMGNGNKIAEFRDGLSYRAFIEQKLEETQGDMSLYNETSETWVITRPQKPVRLNLDRADLYGGDRPYFWPTGAWLD